MENNVRVYGNIHYADIAVGSVVLIGDYYDQVAVGFVDEKKETIDKKFIGVRFGFEKELVNVLIEENDPDGGIPMYQVLSVMR